MVPATTSQGRAEPGGRRARHQAALAREHGATPMIDGNQRPDISRTAASMPPPASSAGSPDPRAHTMESLRTPVRMTPAIFRRLPSTHCRAKAIRSTPCRCRPRWPQALHGNPERRKQCRPVRVDLIAAAEPPIWVRSLLAVPGRAQQPLRAVRVSRRDPEVSIAVRSASR